MNISANKESESDVHELLSDTLEESWKKYRTALKRCQAEFSNEAVHDLRVAGRRILALVQLLSSISAHPRLQKMKRIFKRQLNKFDELRDTQVILAKISEILPELPQLQEFQKYLQETEEKALRQLRKKINKFDTSKVAKRIRKTHDSLEVEGNNDLESNVLQAVDDAYLLTKIRLGWVDLARPATIHRVRVAFKSLRYMIENIHPLLDDFPKENLRQMDEYQSLMGEIQDTEVFVQTFADFSEATSFSDIEPIRRYYERRHAEAVNAYAEDMGRLHTFWRPAPDKPFPWQKPK